MINLINVTLGLLLSICIVGCPINEHPSEKEIIENILELNDKGTQDIDEKDIVYINLKEEDRFGDSYFNYFENEYDAASDIIRDRNGHIFMRVGKTENENAHLLSMNANNEIVWCKSYEENSIDFSESMLETIDGNIVYCGIRREIGATFNDALVVKVDKQGNRIWANTFGEKAFDTARDITQLGDESYVFVGNCITDTVNYTSMIYLVRLDNEGKILAKKKIDKTGVAIGESIVKTEKDDVIFLSDVAKMDKGEDQLFETKENKLFASCYNKELEKIWEKDFGESSSTYHNQIISLDNNEFLIMNNNPLSLIWIDGNGELIQKKMIKQNKKNGVISGISGEFIKKLNNEEFIIACEKRIVSDAYQTKAILFKVNSKGEVSWNKEFGSMNMTNLTGIIKTENGGFITSGYTGNLGESDNTKMITMKLDANGNPVK